MPIKSPIIPPSSWAEAGRSSPTENWKHVRINWLISGGVNIYPREIEDCLITHPKVADVAVFSVPNEDFGEEVKAVVQAMPDIASDEVLAEELLHHCRQELAQYKVPRSIDFEAELPRLPTGKLYKRILRDRYWGKTDSLIV